MTDEVHEAEIDDFRVTIGDKEYVVRFKHETHMPSRLAAQAQAYRHRAGLEGTGR